MSKGIDWYRRPELIMADLIQRAARGDDRHQKVYHRATVLAVDNDGGLLQNETGSGQMSVRLANGQTRTYPALIGPENPRGSIKARILTDGFDRLLDDESVRVFWPMLPFDQIGLPVSPGEHVYVMFEGIGKEQGLWFSRVSGHDSANSFQGVDSYTAPSSKKSAMDSFEENPPEYQRTDEHAGMAPKRDAMKAFGDD